MAPLRPTDGAGNGPCLIAMILFGAAGSSSTRVNGAQGLAANLETDH
jgi:hypothetical protein